MLRVLSAPVLYALELTPACNNRCSGCLNVFSPRGQTRGRDSAPPLDVSQWMSLLEKLAPHAHRLKLTGGEPTLHPHFVEIARQVDRLGTEFVVFTNGRWTDPDALLHLFTELRQLRGILISLHGAIPHSHEAFTNVKGSFEETIRNIERCVRSGIPTTISTVLTRHNWDEVEAITDLAARLGAHHLVFNRHLGPASALDAPDSDHLVAAIQRINQLRREGHPVKFGNCIPQCFVPNDSSGCLAGVAYCAIDPWGNMRPCTHSPLIAGNLLQEELEDVWFSAAMRKFRDAIPPACHHCEAFSVCHGGCRAMGNADPLASFSQTMVSLASKTLTLDPGLRPIGQFTVRREDWGLVLIRGNRIVPVQASALPLLAMLDGHASLADIGMSFGSDGLSLVGSLYQKGLVHLS